MNEDMNHKQGFWAWAEAAEPWYWWPMLAVGNVFQAAGRWLYWRYIG